MADQNEAGGSGWDWWEMRWEQLEPGGQAMRYLLGWIIRSEAMGGHWPTAKEDKLF